MVDTLVDLPPCFVRQTQSPRGDGLPCRPEIIAHVSLKRLRYLLTTQQKSLFPQQTKGFDISPNKTTDWLWSKLPLCWADVLKREVNASAFEQLAICVKQAYTTKTASPIESYLFKAFEYVQPKDVRVVILGRDPYTDNSIAQGLSFAIPSSCRKLPRSLLGVKKELTHEYPESEGAFDVTCLTWAMQGVLMLNTLLTVETNGKPGSHRKLGWLSFTDAVLRCLDKNDSTVFLLWGKHARANARKRNLERAQLAGRVIEAVHPSYQCGKQFVGCDCFKQANDLLRSNGEAEIAWTATS